MFGRPEGDNSDNGKIQTWLPQFSVNSRVFSDIKKVSRQHDLNDLYVAKQCSVSVALRTH
jgi:hypothetical protein